MLIKKLALLFILILGLTFAFHQSLMQWALQLYLSHVSGLDLTYESVQTKPNQFVFNAPLIRLRESKGQVAAESMSISYALHPLERVLKLEIDFVMPEVELHPCQEWVEKMASQLGHSSKWFKVDWRVRCKEGKLRMWHDSEPYNFTFTLDHCSKKECHYTLSSEDGELRFSKEATFIISSQETAERKGVDVKERDEAIAKAIDEERYLRDAPLQPAGLSDEIMKVASEYMFEADHFQLEKLNPLLHTLFPLSKELQFTSGILNGSLSSALVVQNATLQHEKSHSKVKFNEIILRGQKPLTVDFSNGAFTLALEVQNKALPSFASVELAGLKGMAQLKDSLHLSLSGKVGDLKPFISAQFHHGIDQYLSEDTIALDAEMRLTREGIGIEGLLKTGELAIPFGYKQSAGWFTIDALPLEKYVSPFLFPENELALSGKVTCQGSFDGSRISIAYGGDGIQLKNEKLAIELPSIANKSAHYSLDLASLTHSGTIPIKNGSYFDQDTGLLFTEIQAQAHFEGQKVNIVDLEGFSNNIYFAGHGEIDYSSREKGAYTVHLHASSFDGSFSSIQRFFEHFEKPFYFTKIPLEGIVGPSLEGLDLVFDIHEDDYTLSTLFDGSFSEGKILCPHAHLALHELAFNFTYDAPQNRLECNNIQGMLMLGKPEEVEEFSLHADKIHFTDLENENAFFDVYIKDAFHDFARIKGELKGGSKNAIDFHFDCRETHFGTIHPSQLELSLTDWNRLDKFDLKCSFSLDTLVHKLGQGLFQVFGVSKKYLNEVEAEGDFNLHLGFQGENGTFNFGLTGKNVLFNARSFKEMHFAGCFRNNRWFIDELKLDDLSLAAELTKIGSEALKVDFLGLRYGHSFLLGLEGTYSLGSPFFHAKVNLFEADLADYWQEKGKFKGEGELILTREENGAFTLETSLDASLKDAEIKGAILSDVSKCKVHFHSGEGFSVGQLQTEVSTKTHPGKLNLDLNELTYKFKNDAVKIAGLNFNIDAPLLPLVGQTLHTYLPQAIDQDLASQIGVLKSTGTVLGSLNCQLSSLDKHIHMAFGDGIYFLLGEERKLKNLTLEVSKEAIKVSSIYTLNQKPIWAAGTLLSEGSGTVLLTDVACEEMKNPALVIDFQKDPSSGIVVKQAVGYLSGLNINLKENKRTDAHACRLSGEIEVNGKEARGLFSPEWLELFDSLNVGKGYKLQGDFEFLKDYDPFFRFFGTLTGNDIELKGYQFNTLSAQVIYEPHLCQCFNCSLRDPSGILHVGNLKAEKQSEGHWKLHVPLLSIHEMRPSLMRPVEAPRFPRKPLVIRQLSLENITGTLGDPDSFKGDGKLHFSNAQKKNLQNVLFAIPNEILTRIGLNLSVLTPVTGTIHFSLKNGHFVLNKFKDVYSEGRISKFYLPSAGVPSTIDLDGNMNVQVKFKQSTLLLKLAEMFTITVKGHLAAPRYSLERQKYLKREEVFSSDTETL